MKHYTLEEHHIFCVESGIPNREVWHEVANLGWMPEGIYHNPDQSFTPKFKARQKKYNLTPKYKAAKKETDRKYQSTSEYKAKKKEWNKRRYRSNKK